MVARGRRTANPLLGEDGWSGSASADAYAPGLWQSGHRTNDRTIKGQNAFRLASGRACLGNHPSSVKSTLHAHRRAMGIDGASVIMRIGFIAVHESAVGTNATYGARRPMSAVGSRTDVAFGPF